MKDKLLLISIYFLVLIYPGDLRADIVHDIYQYTITDIKHAQSLMQELRKRGDKKNYELNLIEGDIHFNRCDYYEALNFYKRAIYDTQISDSTDWKKDLLLRITPCYLALRDATNMEYFANELYELSVQTKDEEYEIIALFSLGRMYHLAKQPQTAYNKMNAAIAKLEKSEIGNRNSLLFSYRMLLVGYLQQDRYYTEAMKELNKVKDFIKAIPDGHSNTGFEVTQQMWKDIYAHETVLNHYMGKEELAGEFYQKFKVTGNNYQYDYKCIEPYLRTRHLYDDMIFFAKSRMEYLKKVTVTHNIEMLFILHFLADGYMGKGLYKEAAHYYQLLAKLKREILEEKERYNITELTAVYEVKKQELKLNKQLAIERLMTVILIAIVVVVFVLYMAYRIRKNNRKLKHKNQAMSRLLNEYMQEKKHLKNIMRGQSEEAEKQPDNLCENEEQILFNRLINELTNQDLYLNPNLNREMLMQRCKIPKNKFSALFTVNTGMTYSQFINMMRLEHAVELLKQYPNYTVESIAEECGMAAATLYRLFSQRFGMTPTEYREAERQNTIQGSKNRMS